jgi:acylphosphatase
LEIFSFKAVISGFVQGVGYRYYTYQQANRFAITGYVRNLPNGNVEVFAEGKKEILKEFINFLQAGPHYSQVEHVDVRWMKEIRKYNSFKIVY